MAADQLRRRRNLLIGLVANQALDEAVARFERIEFLDGNAQDNLDPGNALWLLRLLLAGPGFVPAGEDNQCYCAGDGTAEEFHGNASSKVRPITKTNNRSSPIAEPTRL